jgi:SAM-dependent methyltransferase
MIMSQPTWRHYAWIFLISMSVLMLEIAIARILSVALLSHYAFVAISLAMFGLGLSGLIVYLFPTYFRRERLEDQLLYFSLAMAVSTSVMVVIFLHVPVTQELSWRGFFSLSFAYTSLLIPFFLGGTCISLLMTHFSSAIGRIYFADLIGASVGCLGIVAAMQFLSAPMVAPVVGALIGIGALALSHPIASTRRPMVFGAVAFALILLVGGMTTNLYSMRYVKTHTEPYSDLELWNSFSRISAFDHHLNAAQSVPLPYPRTFYTDPKFPGTMMLDIDGAAWTPMMNFNGDLSSVQFLRDSVLYAAHHLKPDANVLVIGTGGGRDLLAAKAFDQESVLGIELNPLMRRMVQEEYGDYSGRPYTMDGVEVVIDEARSRLHWVDDSFDVIQLSLIDTFSLNASGGFVFTENNLYTTEAFREYFKHLSDDGILSLTRYYVAAYPVEIMKIITTAREAWSEEGIPSISDRLLVLVQGINATVLVKRSPYTPEELEHITKLARKNRTGVLYSPSGRVGNADIAAVATASDLDSYVDNYPFLINAATDDQPFFFRFLRGRLEIVPDAELDPFLFLLNWDDALALMRLLIAVVAGLAALLFFIPLVLTYRRTVAGTSISLIAPSLLYFACLGYGFMMVEIPLMQGLVLLLGYPVYALAVVLFSLLLFSGIGSLLSSRFEAETGGALSVVLIAIVVVSLGYRFFLPVMIDSLLPTPNFVKIVATVLALGPIGLLLGMAYPLGIGLLRTVGQGLVPWAWGVNGAMSVVASVLGPFLGSRIGFSAAMLTGIFAYFVGLLCVVGIRRHSRMAG